MFTLPRGLIVPLPTALDKNGKFDAPAQERLLHWVGQGRPAAIYSAPGFEGLSPELSRKANEAGHFAATGREHWAGISALSVKELLNNLEHALKLGASAVVLNPLGCADCKEPLQLFHRHIIPFFEKSGKSTAVLLEDAGGAVRLRTRELKQLSRLECVMGLVATGSAKDLGNYLKGARHFKARHEFGVFATNAEMIFPIFQPASGALGALREQWMRLWMGAEHPQGIAPLSAVLFPAAWAQAWDAALSGDSERMKAFEEGFKGLGPVDALRLRAALLEEGVLKSEYIPKGAKALSDSQRQSWLFEYFSTKKELAKLAKTTSVLPGDVIGAIPAAKPVLEGFDVAGIGGVVMDEFRRVPSIAGGNAKIKIQGSAERRPGGVMLNQLSWLSAMGVKSALFGVLGSDAEGDWLRQQARLRGVDVRHLMPHDSSSEVARIFVDDTGEREIYLEPGSACATTAKDIAQFDNLIRRCRLVSTEISVLPLDAVLKVIELAHRHGKPVAVDLDIPASQAAAKGGLGSKAQIQAILMQADYLKTSVEFAKELGGSALSIHRKYKKKKGNWVAVTRGRQGSEISDGIKTVRIAAVKGVKSLDSTGCGDAYMAGLIAGTLHKASLKEIGTLASASGAACALSLGAAAPESGARQALTRHAKGLKFKLAPEVKLDGAKAAGDGAEFLRSAAAELMKLAGRFAPGSFDAAKALVKTAEAQGKRLHVTGVGKPEYVAGYVASSYSSTGTPAFFLHATEAGHGASGQVSPGDVVIAISNSGETEELKGAVSTVKKNGAKVIGVGGKPQSWLARNSDVFLFAGVDREGDLLNMAPRASVLAETAVLSALGVELQQDKNFSADDFRAFHPGGALGKRP